jgi:hypothetical protein
MVPSAKGAWVLALLVAGAVVSVSGQNPERPIRTVGEFSNMRYTEEHAYGYSVELWRDGDSLIGLLLVSEGLQGDTPTGLLENLKFDSRTGALSFTAKLTTGLVLLPGGRSEASRDLFEFSGTLKAAALAGTLKRSDQRRPTAPVSEERIELEQQPPSATLQFASYAEWKRQTDEILARRGPKW